MRRLDHHSLDVVRRSLSCEVPEAVRARWLEGQVDVAVRSAQVKHACPRSAAAEVSNGTPSGTLSTRMPACSSRSAAVSLDRFSCVVAGVMSMSCVGRRAPCTLAA